MAIKLSWKHLFFIVAIAATLLSPGVPLQAQEDTCSCFCTSSKGAVDKNKLTIDDCRDICSASGESIAAFACTANSFPSRNLSCFKETTSEPECSSIGGIWDKNYQPPECIAGSRYCYPDPDKREVTTLQVSIGGYTASKDFGEYISTGYNWLIGASTIFAIVLIMIGGLQWAFGAVSVETVNKAKKRIKNAVIGLILLMSTYLILATVNPQLLKLQVPDFPMIKTVGLLAGETDCLTLKAQGWTVVKDPPNAAGVCGVIATVTHDDNGDPVPDGTVCNYTFCADKSAVCIPGDSPTCMTCEDLTASNPIIPPSPEICEKFNGLPLYQDANTTQTKQVTYTFDGGGVNDGLTTTYDQVQYTRIKECFFTRDPDVGGEILGNGVCALVDLDCNKIKSCTNYDNVQVSYDGGSSSVDLDEINFGQNSGFTSSDLGAFEALYNSLGEITLGSFCSRSVYADVCGWNRVDSEESCYIATTSLVPYVGFELVAPASYECTNN